MIHKIFYTMTVAMLALFVSSCDKNNGDGDDNNVKKESFTFEFKGATYNLTALAVTPTPDGFFIQGILPSTNNIAVLYINSKSSNVNIPFGDQNESGKSGARFNLPTQSDIYSTSGYDCRGQLTYSLGQAKLTAIGDKSGEFIEGTVSGSAYFEEKNCAANEPVKMESFKGDFKIRRKF